MNLNFKVHLLLFIIGAILTSFLIVENYISFYGVHKLFNQPIVSVPRTPITGLLFYDINGKKKKAQLKIASNSSRVTLFNGWNLSHFLMWMILATITIKHIKKTHNNNPKYKKYFICKKLINFFLIGVIWECWETLYGHQNWMDILWNLCGLLSGYIITKYIID